MKPGICLLMGDPSGIGPELVVKLLVRLEEYDSAKVLLLGDRWIFEKARKSVGTNIQIPAITHPDQFAESPSPVFLETDFLRPGDLIPARATFESGTAALKSLRLAVDLAKNGFIDGICYAPLNKEALHLAGMQFPDELRFFAHELGHAGDSGELNVMGDVWTSRVTSHVPLSEVSRLVTVPAVLKAIRLIHRTMQKSGIAAPRIAVAALNPHAGDGGNFGREEIDVIGPAVSEAAAHGIDAQGPFPADTIFLKLRDGLFDAVVTMYHDQGQIAMKLMGFQRGITVAGGLPLPIATPAHGTAFDIAGQCRADVGAMVEAFKLVVRLAGNSRIRVV